MRADAAGVASLYKDVLDVLVIDEKDEGLKPEIEELGPPAGRASPPAERAGLDVVVTDTIMASMEKKTALAKAVLQAAGAR
jgi:hypothetical protein